MSISHHVAQLQCLRFCNLRRFKARQLSFNLHILYNFKNPLKLHLRRNQDDVIRQILGFARRKASVINDQHKELTMLVIIKKETVLAADEFEAMFNARRVEQVYAALAWANEQERSSLRSRFLREMRATQEYISVETLIDERIRESVEQGGIGFEPIPAAQSSIEALEEVVYGGESSAGSCAICMDELVIGCQVN